jgi:hypothetical protein
MQAWSVAFWALLFDYISRVTRSQVSYCFCTGNWHCVEVLFSFGPGGQNIFLEILIFTFWRLCLDCFIILHYVSKVFILIRIVMSD